MKKYDVVVKYNIPISAMYSVTAKNKKEAREKFYKMEDVKDLEMAQEGFTTKMIIDSIKEDTR
jgi:hypothetical protein